MTLEELEYNIFEVTDLNTLYKFQLELSKKVSHLHRLLAEEREEKRKLVLRGDLSWAAELHAICLNRILDERNANGKFNYAFRQLCLKRLSPQLYEQISKEAST